MFEHIFKPLTIRGKTIKNRLVVPPMVTDFCDADGKATEKFLAYHETRAKGGWGLIITEDYAVDPRGRGFSHVAGLWDDGQIESHSELPRRVHKHGATILAQIYHCGRQTNRAVIGGAPVAPTAIACPFGTDVPHELTGAEIKHLIQQYAETAARGQKCGFDGVQIHGAHGYLICEFLSPYSNKRTDEYGGSFINRARFATDIIKAIREKCGDDFIIDMRLSGNERVEGGLELEDIKALVPLLEDAGLDMVHISVGNYLSVDDNVAPAEVPHAWITDWAQEVKKVCNIPVTTVSRINDPFMAENILRQNKADFVAMGRQSLADPDTPEKTRQGKLNDIRHCIACNDGCIGTLFGDHAIRCVINPQLGREHEGAPTKAEKRKKVVVIGAGPAGLTAALTAAQKGHEVAVYEKTFRPGGQFYVAAIPPCKCEIADFIGWQVAQCKNMNIPVHYGTEADAKMIRDLKPDVVILASGGVPAVPPIEGLETPGVCTVPDILLGNIMPGKNCVVIGGGQAGIETAHFLAQMMRNVTVLEFLDTIAPEEAIGPRMKRLKMLADRNVKLFTGMKVTKITADSVIAAAKDGKEHAFPADTVVIATGTKSFNSLEKDLKDAGLDVRTIGDARRVGKVLEATTQGYETAAAI